MIVIRKNDRFEIQFEGALWSDAWRAEKDFAKKCGFRFEGDTKTWWTSYPETAAKILEEGTASEEVREELTAIHEKKKASLEMSRAASSDREFDCPDGLNYIPFQKAGIAFGLDRPSTLIGDEMGLGKTIQAIGIINGDPSIRRVLIIVPASLKINWYRELEKWLTREYSIGIASGSSFPDTDIVITNYDIISRHATFTKEKDKKGKDRVKVSGLSAKISGPWDLVISDEAHYVKSYKAKRTMVWNEITKHGKRNVCLTGTPILNRPNELYTILCALDPAWRGKFWYYHKRYCAARQDGYGWDFSGASNLDELQRTLRETVMIRRLKEDVLTELPPKFRQIIEIQNGFDIEYEAEYEEAGRREIEEAEAARDAIEDPNSDEYERAVNRLQDIRRIFFSEISRIRHQTALLKVPYVVDHVKELLDTTEKVVIMAWHKDVIDGLREGLSEFGVVSLTGDDSQKDRQAAVDEFQEGTARVFIGSIKAAGVGITLTASSTVVFAEIDWVPANLTQAEDRCHRIGQASNVLVQHVVLNGSIDARLAKTTVEKQRVLDEALDKEPAKKETGTVAKMVEDAKKEAAEEASQTDGKRNGRPRQSRKPQQEEFSAEERADILLMAQLLAGQCDGAATWDGVGFNKFDAHFGHDIAERGIFTDKQAAAVKKMVRKYKKQLLAYGPTADAYNRIYGGTSE